MRRLIPKGDHAIGLAFDCTPDGPMCGLAKWHIGQNEVLLYEQYNPDMMHRLESRILHANTVEGIDYVYLEDMQARGIHSLATRKTERGEQWIRALHKHILQFMRSLCIPYKHVPYADTVKRCSREDIRSVFKSARRSTEIERHALMTIFAACPPTEGPWAEGYKVMLARRKC